MGAAVSAYREELLAGDNANKKDVKEQLDFLVTATQAKLDSYQAELEAYVYHYGFMVLFANKM
jgi:hypothetical protein